MVRHNRASSSVMDVAKLLLSHDQRLNAQKLIKLVYIAHGWMLGEYGKPLFKEEIEAWEYGPMVPDLYYEIRSKNRDNGYFLNQDIFDDQANPDSLSDTQKDVIRDVAEAYKSCNARKLTKLTHSDGSPWEMACALGEIQITDDIIEHYYQNRVERIKAMRTYLKNERETAAEHAR